ncbi:MAG: transporter substrate-binding protein [Sulfurimonas sp.]|uniref:transporter substrate-binding protein n=1 Tax=Sulfurimonas sp. TaxID=2022749 RepID=UPI00262483EC|nr:transporter substrate-binding protein [Sulfurimonas sp.]MDD5399867.1 transporter substrate-binding protein [Sulfurimonas sp.]
MRTFIAIFSIATFIAALLVAFVGIKKESIKIGLLYSATGTMSTNEKPLGDILRAAAREINRSGGLLNRELEIIEFDGKSDSKEFKKGAKELIDKGVVAIFGCWTSASRKEVKEIVESANSILFYPVQYEGFESSPNIVYLGLSANQQVNPTIDFIKSNFGNNIYLVGSDYIYPKATNFYINELSKLTDLHVVGEKYFTLGSSDFKDLFEDIKSKKPDAIINTLNGDSNIEFFKKLQEFNITSDIVPVISLSVDEASLLEISKHVQNSATLGHYATWGYFKGINDGQNKFTTDAMFSMYLGIELFKQAVLKSKEITSAEILKNIKRTSVNISDNIFYVDPINQHVHRKVFIGKINNQNQFDIVWQSKYIINPQPYPPFKEIDFWENGINEIYKSFGNSWEGKGDTK